MSSLPRGSSYEQWLPSEATLTWDFSSGRGLDALGLTIWGRSSAVLTLLRVLVGGVRPSHHSLPSEADRLKEAQTVSSDIAETFEAGAEAVRRGEREPMSVAADYLPRNTTARRKQAISRLFETAARENDQDSADRALLALCNQGPEGRKTTESYKLDWDAVDAIELQGPPGEVIPHPSDRVSALQSRWHKAIFDGSWLLGLRGTGRCLACERRLSEERVEGRRVDYCFPCCQRPPGNAESQKERLVSAHNEQIRQVLDAVTPALPERPQPLQTYQPSRQPG